MEGESIYTTLIVACGGERRDWRAINYGGFIVIKGVAVDGRESLANLVLLDLGIVNSLYLMVKSHGRTPWLRPMATPISC